MLTRTDFLIQFIWQPPKAEDKPKDAEEAKTKLEEETKKLIEAQKNQSVVNIKEADLEKASLQQSQVIDTALQDAQQKAVAAAGAAAGAPTAPAAPAAPGAPATPAAPTPPAATPK